MRLVLSLLSGALALLMVLALPAAADDSTSSDGPTGTGGMPGTGSEGAGQEDSQVIQDGSKVAVQYTLKLDDGTTADTNVGGEPLVYQQGADQMLPAFEKKLQGMQVDETTEFTLPPEQGYGEVDPSLRQEVDADLVEEPGRRVGAQLVAQDPSGQQRVVRVHEVRDDTLVLDLNHPLAGETLHFDVKVLAIE